LGSGGFRQALNRGSAPSPGLLRNPASAPRSGERCEALHSGAAITIINFFQPILNASLLTLAPSLFQLSVVFPRDRLPLLRIMLGLRLRRR